MILAVFGEGGHREQMQRLLRHLDLQPPVIVAIVDRTKISSGLACAEFVTLPLRRKNQRFLFNPFALFIALASQLYAVASVLLGYRISGVLCTGPGICILPSAVFRLLGKNVIFIETWARFESKSYTGRFLERIASHLFIQTEELKPYYPKARYCGRL